MTERCFFISLPCYTNEELRPFLMMMIIFDFRFFSATESKHAILLIGTHTLSQRVNPALPLLVSDKARLSPSRGH
jgi:hypothetical protein